MTAKQVSIGMDDIDSPREGCTTHFASLLIEKLERMNVTWSDYPSLIRLNPNIPYRTRGNGAICLRFSIEEDKIGDLLPLVKEMITEYIDVQYPNTNPGVVLVRDEVPKTLQDFAKQALWRTIPLAHAQRTIEVLDLPFIAMGNGRGLIGALASIGNFLLNDYTFEYIAYRALESCSSKRGVDPASVFDMDQRMQNRTFSNVDHEVGTILVEPQGPDPVIFGIRGETAEDVKEASTFIQSDQKTNRWMIFRSNQGTGEHLQNRVTVSNLRPYMSATVIGDIGSTARIIAGGHVIFEITDDTGKIDCAVYEPSGKFREAASKLIIGDHVIISGGVRPASRTHGLTLNVEGIEVLILADDIEYTNPVCPECAKRLKSAGVNKGFKCVRCGHKDPNALKITTTIPRKISVGKHLPPLSAQRHLTRPLSRSTMNKAKPRMIAEWHFP